MKFLYIAITIFYMSTCSNENLVTPVDDLIIEKDTIELPRKIKGR